MYIMKLLPVGKDYLWGGDRLKVEYGKKLKQTPLAESWECSVHPDGLSTIANGEYAGSTLVQVLSDHPEYLGSKVGERKELPILVKLIDAKDRLSVQVHPDDNFARVHEGDNGKSEMWYVVDAKEDSFITYGFAHDVDRVTLEQAIANGQLDKHLQKVQVHKGDLFYVPAGVVHGLGAGILVAEVQESSNVTYRVYDYDRLDKNGNKRELHFEKALQVMDMQEAPMVKKKARFIHYYPGCSREMLCRCKYFEAERVVTNTGFAFSVLETSFNVLLCLEGSGTIEIGGQREKPIWFEKGDCLFVPANAGRCYLFGKSVLLKVRC